MTTPEVLKSNFNIVNPVDYATWGYPHDVWTQLRHEDPVHWWDQTEGNPFWAVTKHADIIELSTQPKLFNSSPRLVITHIRQARQQLGETPLTLIDFDPPKHLVWRRLVNKRFTPGAMKRYRPAIERIGKGIVDDLFAEGDSGECDFVEKISAPLPIAVIGWMLGVPEKDWPLLFDWTNRAIGAQDPEYQTEGETARETSEAATRELFTYFAELVAEKQKDPKDDLVTVFSQVEVEGKRLDLPDVLAWCFLIVLAGNETTRNSTSGGMLAFIEHQDALRQLQADPSLLRSGIEEVLRWTSPIIHFARTATEDYELRGRRIRAGQSVGLFYASANRDEEIFEDPFTFDVTRDPNRHLAFGVGEHFCLGAHIARLELEVAYRHLLPRIDEIELAGEVERLHSALVGGIKHLPIRYKLRPAA